MNSNKTQLFLVASIASVMVLAGVASEQAFAHGGQGFFVTLPNGESRQITVVIGHNNEPTTAQETGQSSGNHPMELFIRDSATGLNLADADLKVTNTITRMIKNSTKLQKKALNQEKQM